MIIESSTLNKFPDFFNHKYVIEAHDEDSGLHTYVAIHNNNLGPATGGTRMLLYSSSVDAISDALRLSKAMTYKCALAGVKFGGGKAVIIADPKTNKTSKLLVAYSDVINNINKLICEYTTGEDVGINNEDVNYMRQYSQYLLGSEKRAGDPSPYASLSTLTAMKAAVKNLLNKDSLKGVSVAVKGVGKVGGYLVELLVSEGADVYISDIDVNKAKEIASKFSGVKAIENEKINKLEVDVYAPCALGNEFTEDTISLIKAKIICGAANNQLSSDQIGDELYKNGIWYIPDYVANAGGLINVVDELEENGYQNERVLERISNIEKTVEKIIKKSRDTKVPTHTLADKMAEELFLKQ